LRGPLGLDFGPLDLNAMLPVFAHLTPGEDNGE
jgi:hypothetical protein